MKTTHLKVGNRIAVLGIGLTILSACGGNKQGMKLSDNEFAVQKVSVTSTSQSNMYPATIKGTQDIEIRPQISGAIVKLCVDEGAKVRKGQALFQVDATQYRAVHQQAVASVASAKANLATVKLTEENKRTLHEQKIISDFEFQSAVNKRLTAEASLAQAEAALASAKQNLDFCTITSPSDGVIGTFPYRVGSLVSPSIQMPMTTVSQIEDMYVYFSLTEKQLLSMTKSDKSVEEQLKDMPAVQLQLADGSLYECKGRIDAVSGVIDPQTGSAQMRAIFPNKKHILRSGGMANIILPSVLENIILVPQWATQEIQDKKFVYVLQPDSTLKHTEVKIANLNDGKNYIVTGGIKEGDAIVVEGVQTLRDKMKIVPVTRAQQEAKYKAALKDQKEGNLKTAFQ